MDTEGDRPGASTRNDSQVFQVKAECLGKKGMNQQDIIKKERVAWFDWRDWVVLSMFVNI